MFGASLDLLANVGAEERIAERAIGLSGLRLIDGTGGLLRAPELLFEAREIGREYFGFNIENRVLEDVLWQLVEANENVLLRGQTARAIEIEEGRVSIVLADGSTVTSSLLVGADGERSICRKAADIGARTWTYPQTAIATRFAHQRPHGGVSTEFHRRAGPLTTVPLEGNWSSLVWVEVPAEAGRLSGLADREFARALETSLEGVLGGVGEVGPRACFPLTGLEAERLGANRTALVGEAGHRLPPIGAQGLNLGIRDAAWLAEIVSDAVSLGQDPGGPAVMAAYDRARHNDVASRLAAVDILNRSLIADFLPVDLARGLGVMALRGVTSFRQLVMREGVAPAGPLPRLLKPCGSAQA